MIRGLYTAAAGMLASGLMESDIANNIANTGTPGYRGVQPVLTAFAPMLLSRFQAGAVQPLGVVSGGSAVAATVLDMSAGPLTRDGNRLSAAIHGAGFFAVQTPQGVQYTRAGAFQIDAQGRLATASGDPVLGVGGAPLRVPAPDRAAAALTAQGDLVAGGALIGRVGVFEPSAGALAPAGGGGMYALAAGAAAPAPVAGATLSPGWVEGSNVDLVAQMASLLQVEQAYASDQQAVLAAGRTMTAAISQVGTVA